MKASTSCWNLKVVAIAAMHATETTPQIFIVDRDLAVAGPLRLDLQNAGFAVRAIADKASAIEAIAQRPPQLVIFDWDLPRYGGLELIEAVRGANPPGIGLIILSALSNEHDVVNGLNLGADDYIAKPCSCREVVARTQAVLRARSRRQSQGNTLCGDLVLDAATNSVTVRHRLLNLSPVEYRLLEFLMKHPGKVFTRLQLLAKVWGSESEIDERTVDVNVQRLRRVLGDSGYELYVETVRGFGYRFSAYTPVRPE